MVVDGTPLLFRYQEVRTLADADGSTPGQVSITSERLNTDALTALQLIITAKLYPSPPAMHERWGVSR